jgi:hypothetical protein
MRSRRCVLVVPVLVALAACGGEQQAAPMTAPPVSIGWEERPAPVTTSTVAPTTTTTTTTVPTTSTRVDPASTDRAAVEAQVAADFLRNQTRLIELNASPMSLDRVAEYDTFAVPGSEVHTSLIESAAQRVGDGTYSVPLDPTQPFRTTTVEVVSLDGDGPWTEAQIRVCDRRQQERIKSGPQGEAVLIEGTALTGSDRRWFTMEFTDGGWKLRDFGAGEGFLTFECPAL